MWIQDTPLTTPASAAKWQFHLQLTGIRYDAGTTFAVALYGPQCLPVLPVLTQSITWAGQLAPHTGFAGTSTKEKKNQTPTDDKIPQPCLSSLLIPAALSQVELYYSISLSLSLSQHSNYVKYGIKQAKAQKQQWNSVSFHQFCCWQSQPSVPISAVCIDCVSETPSFLRV